MSADTHYPKADNLIDAFQVCDLKSLEGETMESYYVDLKNVRKTKAIAGVNARLTTLEPGEYATLYLLDIAAVAKAPNSIASKIAEIRSIALFISKRMPCWILTILNIWICIWPLSSKSQMNSRSYN